MVDQNRCRYTEERLNRSFEQERPPHSDNEPHSVLIGGRNDRLQNSALVRTPPMYLKNIPNVHQENLPNFHQENAGKIHLNTQPPYDTNSTSDRTLVINDYVRSEEIELNHVHYHEFSKTSAKTTFANATTTNPVCKTEQQQCQVLQNVCNYRKQDQIVHCDCCTNLSSAKRGVLAQPQQQQQHEHSSAVDSTDSVVDINSGQNELELQHQGGGQLQQQALPDSFAYREANRKFSNLVSRIL